MEAWKMVEILAGVIASGFFAWAGVVFTQQGKINKDLYEKNNNNDRRLTHIETIHQLRGCDMPIKKPE